jgi:hypothetical protein
MTVALAEGTRNGAPHSRLPRGGVRPGLHSDDRLLRYAPFLLALLVYGVSYHYMQPTPTGDEPHYLLYSHSLVFDGDADLANNYDQATIQRYFPYYTRLDPHGREYLGDGTLHSIHYLGLPLLIAPIIWAGGGLDAVRTLMILLSALLALQLFWLLRDIHIAGTGDIWLAWVATALALPMVMFSGQVYPELPGALIIVSCLRVLIRPQPSRCCPGCISASWCSWGGWDWRCSTTWSAGRRHLVACWPACASCASHRAGWRTDGSSGRSCCRPRASGCSDW